MASKSLFFIGDAVVGFCTLWILETGSLWLL